MYTPLLVCTARHMPRPSTRGASVIIHAYLSRMLDGNAKHDATLQRQLVQKRHSKYFLQERPSKNFLNNTELTTWDSKGLSKRHEANKFGPRRLYSLVEYPHEPQPV